MHPKQIDALMRGPEILKSIHIKEPNTVRWERERERE